MLSFLQLKLSALLAAKFMPMIKVGVGVAAIMIAATEIGVPVPTHDPFFYMVAFMLVGSVVGGEPEPDSKLTGPQFWYLWFYRSSHLFISAATAYMLHKNKWGTINGGDNVSPTTTTTTLAEEKS